MSINTDNIPVQETEDPNFGLAEMNTYPIDTLLDSVVPFTGLDLCNDIHPVFQRAQFPGAEWEALLPALKLASRLLDTDCLLQYWYTTNADGTIMQYSEGAGYDECDYLAAFPPHEKITADDIKETKTFLRQLAMAVRFRREEPDDGLHSTGYAMACKRQHVRSHELGISEEFFGRHGCGSDAFYSERLYQNLLRLHHGGQASSSKALLLHFSLAVTLLHELAHAANFSRHGATEEERPLGTRTVAEAGFDWSESVFGGDPDLVCGTVEMTEWPTATICRFYLQINAPLFVYGPLPDEVSRQWVEPTTWILQLFQTEFWETVVEKGGAEALQAPRLLGSRTRTSKCDCSSCQTPWNGNNLLMCDLMKDNPASPSCVAGIERWVPDSDDDDILEGVPEGYALLADGTLVLGRFAHLMHTPKVTPNRASHADKAALTSPDVVRTGVQLEEHGAGEAQA